MRWTIRFFLTIAVIILIASGTVFADDWTWSIEQITNNNYGDYNFEASSWNGDNFGPVTNQNGDIAWTKRHGRYSDVYFFNSQDKSISQLSYNLNPVGSYAGARLNSNGDVAWDNSGSGGIWMRQNGITKQITADGSSTFDVEINSKGDAIFVGPAPAGNSNALYYYSNGVTKYIGGGVERAKISDNGDAVWESGGSIYLYHNGNTSLLHPSTPSSLNGYDFKADINNNGQVVWATQNDGYNSRGSSVYFYDGVNAPYILNPSSPYSSLSGPNGPGPQIDNNGHIVWEVNGIGGGIYYFDGAKITQLTDNINDRFPQIYDSKIVWQQSGNIYYWGGEDIMQISTTGYSTNPHIMGNNIVWSSWDGVDNEIFRATPNVVPEPTSMLLFGLGGMGMAFMKRKRKA